MGGAPAFFFFFFQAEDGIRDVAVTGVQTCALPICGDDDGGDDDDDGDDDDEHDDDDDDDDDNCNRNCNCDW